MKTAVGLSSLFGAALIVASCGGGEADMPAPMPEAKSAPAEMGYTVVDVMDGGSISGTVKLSGAAPVIPAISISKDQSTCGHSKLAPVFIGSASGVANVVVLLTDIHQGAEAVPLEGENAPMLDQKKCEYTPHVMTVPVGTEVNFVSSDNIAHNIHAYLGDATVFNAGYSYAGEGKKKLLDEAGMVRLKCDAGHDWMSAWIFVTEHPYYAVTGADGSFTLENVPAGTYTIEAMHEPWSIDEMGQPEGDWIGTSMSVTVEAGKAATVTFELGGSSTS